MLDEPFMGLSPKLVQRFCNSFRELRQSGVTLLISGQLMQRVLNVAEKAYVLEKGRITFSGTGPHLLEDPHLQEIIFFRKVSCAGFALPTFFSSQASRPCRCWAEACGYQILASNISVS
jgi:ABC-type multidrug transport system ATPase subunit